MVREASDLSDVQYGIKTSVYQIEGYKISLSRQKVADMLYEEGWEGVEWKTGGYQEKNVYYTVAVFYGKLGWWWGCEQKEVRTRLLADASFKDISPQNTPTGLHECFSAHATQLSPPLAALLRHPPSVFQRVRRLLLSKRRWAGDLQREGKNFPYSLKLDYAQVKCK